jgi:hypothetical protein
MKEEREEKKSIAYTDMSMSIQEAGYYIPSRRTAERRWEATVLGGGERERQKDRETERHKGIKA